MLGIIIIAVGGLPVYLFPKTNRFGPWLASASCKVYMLRKARKPSNCILPGGTPGRQARHHVPRYISGCFYVEPLRFDDETG